MSCFLKLCWIRFSFVALPRLVSWKFVNLLKLAGSYWNCQEFARCCFWILCHSMDFPESSTMLPMLQWLHCPRNVFHTNFNNSRSWAFSIAFLAFDLLSHCLDTATMYRQTRGYPVQNGYLWATYIFQELIYQIFMRSDGVSMSFLKCSCVSWKYNNCAQFGIIY